MMMENWKVSFWGVVDLFGSCCCCVMFSEIFRVGKLRIIGLLFFSLVWCRLVLLVLCWNKITDKGELQIINDWVAELCADVLIGQYQSLSYKLLGHLYRYRAHFGFPFLLNVCILQLTSINHNEESGFCHSPVECFNSSNLTSNKAWPNWVYLTFLAWFRHTNFRSGIARRGRTDEELYRKQCCCLRIQFLNGFTSLIFWIVFVLEARWAYNTAPTFFLSQRST